MSQIGMLYNLIALGFIALLVIIITIILARKIPYVKTLDVKTIAEEKELQLKEKILIQRIRRRANQGKHMVASLTGPSRTKVRNVFQKFTDWLVALDKKYQREASKKHVVVDAEMEERLRLLLDEADLAMKREDITEAEKKYIEIISLDVQNKRAYQGLSKLYRQQKEYQQAIQTLKYVLKLDTKQCEVLKKQQGISGDLCPNAPDMCEDYRNLGEVYLDMAEPAQAAKYFEKALIQMPNHPKTLDLLIQTCILLRDRSNAVDYFRKLKEVNPENQKLLEYKEKLDEM